MKNIMKIIVGTTIATGALCAQPQTPPGPGAPPNSPPAGPSQIRRVETIQRFGVGGPGGSAAAAFSGGAGVQPPVGMPEFRGSALPEIEGNRTLVVPSGSAEPGEVMETEEDLNVMARILKKAADAGEMPGRIAMGIAIQNALHSGDGNIRNLYLDGYGALFLVNVPFPIAPPAAHGRGPEKEPPPSSEWEEARRELHAGPQAGMGGGFSMAFAGRFGPVPPYDEKKVEALKEDLVSALKNAVHIRALKPDEQVTIVITGPEGPVAPRALPRPPGGPGSEENPIAPPQPLVPRMVLKAKVKDIKAFQKGAMDLEKFRDKVEISVS